MIEQMLSLAEREAIGVCIAAEALDAIVNRALLEVPAHFTPGEEIEVRFPAREHQQLFLIRLLDFAREKGDGSLTGVSGTCLDVLRAASRTSSFGDHEGARELERAARAFDEWLSAETEYSIWLPTLGLNADLASERWELLRIAGNEAKHNLSRLSGISKRVQEMLARNGHHVDLERIPLAIEDFREHLQEDYFVYYATWLAELANNLRWAIQDYLRAEFSRAYMPGEGAAYTYGFPDSITSELGREWYRRLMNRVRSGPHIPRFVGTRYVKKGILR